MFTGIIGALGTVESVQPVYDAQGTSELHISLLTLVILSLTWIMEDP